MSGVGPLGACRDNINQKQGFKRTSKLKDGEPKIKQKWLLDDACLTTLNQVSIIIFTFFEGLRWTRGNIGVSIICHMCLRINLKLSFKAELS